MNSNTIDDYRSLQKKAEFLRKKMLKSRKSEIARKKINFIRLGIHKKMGRIQKLNNTVAVSTLRLHSGLRKKKV